MSGAPPDKTDTQRSARLMSAPRISELSLSDGGDSGSFDSKTNTPSPKGDADASDRVRSLEAKVKLLEQQLIEKGGSAVVPRPFLARLHFPSTESDGGSSTVLTPSDLHGSNSPIADDASDIPEEESAVAGSYRCVVVSIIQSNIFHCHAPCFQCCLEIFCLCLFFLQVIISIADVCCWFPGCWLFHKCAPTQLHRSPDGGAAGAGVDEDYQDEVPEELEAPALVCTRFSAQVCDRPVHST